MSEPIEVNAEEDLPVATWSGTQELFGFRLTVHVLSTGERVYEDNDELRKMLAWLTDNGSALDGAKGGEL